MLSKFWRVTRSTAVQVAVFDTAFHQTMPPAAYMYALPHEYHEKYHVRKYGFHGTSVKYLVGQVHNAQQALHGPQFHASTESPSHKSHHFNQSAAYVRPDAAVSVEYLLSNDALRNNFQAMADKKAGRLHSGCTDAGEAGEPAEPHCGTLGRWSQRHSHPEWQEH